jgi:23S rRNA U2552 (ribose-2'-O)-methylase RlmE/FtsJ
MKVLTIIASLLVSSLVLAADPPLYSLSVDVKPMNAAEGVYVCAARITDLTTGNTLSEPTVTLRAGEPANMTTTDGDLKSNLTLSVDQASSTATAELTVTRAGKVVAAQKSSIRLR